MAQRQGLTTNLVGRRICPKPEYGSCENDHDPNGRIWGQAGLKPSLSGNYTAEIDAAWTVDGTTKIAVHDPWGNIAELWLTQVNLYLQQ